MSYAPAWTIILLVVVNVLVAAAYTWKLQSQEKRIKRLEQCVAFYDKHLKAPIERMQPADVQPPPAKPERHTETDQLPPLKKARRESIWNNPLMPTSFALPGLIIGVLVVGIAAFLIYTRWPRVEIFGGELMPRAAYDALLNHANAWKKVYGDVVVRITVNRRAPNGQVPISLGVAAEEGLDRNTITDDIWCGHMVILRAGNATFDGDWILMRVNTNRWIGPYADRDLSDMPEYAQSGCGT